jgi:hypothetical protein
VQLFLRKKRQSALLIVFFWGSDTKKKKEGKKKNGRRCGERLPWLCLCQGKKEENEKQKRKTQVKKTTQSNSVSFFSLGSLISSSLIHDSTKEKKKGERLERQERKGLMWR